MESSYREKEVKENRCIERCTLTVPENLGSKSYLGVSPSTRLRAEPNKDARVSPISSHLNFVNVQMRNHPVLGPYEDILLTSQSLQMAGGDR